MTKRALLNRIAVAAGLSKVQTAQVVELWMEQLGEELAEKGRVELRGFGVFTVAEHKPFATVSPRTGEPLEVQSQRQIHFKAGKQLKAKVNPGDEG